MGLCNLISITLHSFSSLLWGHEILNMWFLRSSTSLGIGFFSTLLPIYSDGVSCCHLYLTHLQSEVKHVPLRSQISSIPAAFIYDIGTSSPLTTFLTFLPLNIFNFLRVYNPNFNTLSVMLSIPWCVLFATPIQQSPVVNKSNHLLSLRMHLTSHMLLRKFL